MNTDTEYLKNIAVAIATNPDANFPTQQKANYHLEIEARRLEQSIIQNLQTIESFTQRETFYFNTLNKLVQICDILFAVDPSVGADVQIVLELILNVNAALPHETRPNLKLPKAFVLSKGRELAEHWSFFEQEMKKHGISPALLE